MVLQFDMVAGGLGGLTQSFASEMKNDQPRNETGRL